MCRDFMIISCLYCFVKELFSKTFATTLLWAAKVANTIRLEPRESPRLETRVSIWAFNSCANHLFDG